MNTSKSLLLVDNTSVLDLLHQGTYRFQEISFEEVKAIIEMHDYREIIRCFSNVDIDNMLYKHVGVALGNFHYFPVDELSPGQDAIVFRLYVTPSETTPSISTIYGNQATKIQNLYVYCQFITRVDEG